MDNIITLKKMRESVQKYADEVKKGKTFIVFKRSKPIFKISPVEEELWEDVVDFTKIKRGGIDIKELLKRL